MWASVKSVLFPEKINEAVELSLQEGHAVFAGGTYLVAEKDYSIHTLIDINHLIPVSISYENEEFLVDAGVTLQELINSVQDEGIAPVVQAARDCCFSKNIRNQRTIGGEIAQNRGDSDFVAILQALDATLHVFTDDHYALPFAQWDGGGILTGFKINFKDIQNIKTYRYALLDSAPAFLIVCAVQRAENIHISIYGRTDQCVITEIEPENFGETFITDFAEKASIGFPDDHFGSVEYKKSLIATSLRRYKAEL